MSQRRTFSEANSDQQDLAAQTARQYQLGIVGGGPAGTGPLFSALQDGRLPQLLDQGVAVFESSDALAKGHLGELDLNSDTLSNAFLEILDKDPDSLLGDIRSADATKEIESWRGRSVPLSIVGEYLEALGKRLQDIIDDHRESYAHLNTTVSAVHRLGDRTFIIEGRNSAGPVEAFCRNVVVATGGYQNLAETQAEQVLGRPWLAEPEFRQKLILTGDILQGRVPMDQLFAGPNPRVVILGASHSAFSVAWYLLQHAGQHLGDDSIRILHRGRPKLFFGSSEEATTAGYNDFNDFDICPLTKRVYRLGGLRFDGRGLLMQLLGVGDAKPEPRVRLEPLDTVGDDLVSLLKQADVIVPAFGYRPNAIPFFDGGEPLALNADDGGALVDDQCRLLNGRGEPIPGAFAIGLASGFIPHGKLGGEPSFRGQTNGFWLYQNGVGQVIVDAVAGEKAETLAEVQG